jgi:hypothetical protein
MACVCPLSSWTFRRKAYLYNNPYLIEEIPFPSTGIDPYWVNVLAKEDANHGGYILNGETIGTQAIRKDFERIRNVEGNPKIP